MKIETRNGKKSARISYYDKEGNRKQKRFTADTAAEVRRLVSEFESNLSHYDPDEYTLLDASNTYIESKSNILSPNTIREYKRITRTAFQDIIHLNIHTISATMFQEEVNKLSLTCSPKTVRNYSSFYLKVMRTFAPDIAINPSYPQKEPTEFYIPTDSDIKKLIEVSKGTNMEIPILLGAYLGLRRGEIAALTYDDFDLKKETVTINKALAKDADRKYVIKQPKSYSGNRILDLPKPIVEAIKERKKADKPLIEITMPVITDRFPDMIRAAELPHFKFHALRHYFASKLLEAGVSDLYAIKLTGHSTVTMLKAVYQHTMPEKEKAVREQVKNLF